MVRSKRTGPRSLFPSEVDASGSGKRTKVEPPRITLEVIVGSRMDNQWIDITTVSVTDVRGTSGVYLLGEDEKNPISIHVCSPPPLLNMQTTLSHHQVKYKIEPTR